MGQPPSGVQRVLLCVNAHSGIKLEGQYSGKRDLQEHVLTVRVLLQAVRLVVTLIKSPSITSYPQQDMSVTLAFSNRDILAFHFVNEQSFRDVDVHVRVLAGQNNFRSAKSCDVKQYYKNHNDDLADDSNNTRHNADNKLKTRIAIIMIKNLHLT